MTEEADARGLVTVLYDHNDVMLLQHQSLLAAAGIEAFVEGGMQEFSMFAANLHPFGEGPVLRVRAEQLARAHQVLCENGVVCPIPEGGVARLIERLVRPLLADPEADRQRLADLLEGLSKDFRAELFREILALSGGQALLESLLCDAIDQGGGDEPLRRDLGQALAKDTPGETCQRLLPLAETASPPARVRLARSLARFACTEAATTLAGLLSDEQAEVRDEALEGLFVLSGGRSFDFDPAASPAEREGPAAQWRSWAEAYRPR